MSNDHIIENTHLYMMWRDSFFPVHLPFVQPFSLPYLQMESFCKYFFLKSDSVYSLADLKQLTKSPAVQQKEEYFYLDSKN